MRRLVFLVEGQTELLFVRNQLIPYLYERGATRAMGAQKIMTNRSLNKKGGNVAYAYLKNDVARILAQGNVVVTTLLDFFRLPTDFPAYSARVSDIEKIEQAIWVDLGKSTHVYPYIQQHELEALMFSGMEGFEYVVDDDAALQQLQKVIAQYPNPEDINNSPATAPSKRLEAIFPYDKVGDGEMILEALGIDLIRDKCPRFDAWISLLEGLAP